MKQVEFKLLAVKKNSNDWIDVNEENKDDIENVWIESEVMGYDQAQNELKEIYENKLIRVELLRWQKQLLKSSHIEVTSMGRFLADEIENRFFKILKPSKDRDQTLKKLKERRKNKFEL